MHGKLGACQVKLGKRLQNKTYLFSSFHMKHHKLFEKHQHLVKLFILLLHLFADATVGNNPK